MSAKNSGNITSSIQHHKNQVAWQIILPMIIGALLVSALMVFVVLLTFPGPSSVETWRDLSLIFMIAPVMIGGLCVFVILAALIYGIARLLGVIPVYTRKIQTFFDLVSVVVRNQANKVVKPILIINGWAAAWETFWARF
jgi:hypothetical protein